MIMPALTDRKDYIDMEGLDVLEQLQRMKIKAEEKHMENTKENVVKLLEEMRRNSFITANTIKFTDYELARVMNNHALDYQVCIWLLTDVDFFKDTWKIYFNEEDK